MYLYVSLPRFVHTMFNSLLQNLACLSIFPTRVAFFTCILRDISVIFSRVPHTIVSGIVGERTSSEALWYYAQTLLGRNRFGFFFSSAAVAVVVATAV